MNVNKSDVLVIGGGTAACAAAAAALDEGKQVTMVFPNGGSSEISAGMLDIMGVLPGENPVVCKDYGKGIEKLLEKYPGHIYTNCKHCLEDGVQSILSLSEDGGYTLKGIEGENVWAPNMLGTFSISAYVPSMMDEGILIPDKNERVLVVGIKGNVNFNAKAAAMSYGKYQKKLGGKAEYFSTEIEIKGWGDRRKISDGELADYFDTKEGREELLRLIQTFCENNKYSFDKILFPPVLGYLHYNDILKNLKAVCGCNVAEVAAWGNSVVGYRFTRAIYKGLEKKGAKLMRSAFAKQLEPGKDAVRVACICGLTDQYHAGQKESFEAPAVVLATGGFVGGGIKARHTEVWVELLEEHLGKVTTDQLDRNVINPSGQDFMRMGVRVNADMSVKDEKYSGRVFACGDILAGHNFASERSGAGIAIASGYLAGKSAVTKV